MNRKAKAYSIFIIAAGLLFAVESFRTYIINFGQIADVGKEIQTMLIMTGLCVLCRSFPLYIRSNEALDMSLLSLFATVLVKGPEAAVIIMVISSFFVFERDETKKSKIRTIYNTELIKTAFNVSNFVISIYVSGLLYRLVGGVPGVITMPGIIIPSIVFLIFAFGINAVLLMGLFALNLKMKLIPSLKTVFSGLLPNIAAAAPIGYFLAMFFVMPDGDYMAILFFMPLLLARYVFKLYIDAKAQYYKILQTLAAAIEAKDAYTEGHSRRVEMYAEQIAREMHLPEKKIEAICAAALLHDIGKIGIDDRILRKPGRLTSTERLRIEEHPIIGVRILDDIGMSKITKDAILHHHERYDGSGYPDGIKLSDGHLESCILGVADAYDAMTSERPYRGALSQEKAIEILRQESGKQFHPEVVEALIRSLEKNK